MPDLTIATFNTHWGLERGGRPYDVVPTAARLDADVLVLQEVWRRAGEPAWVDRLATELCYADVREVVLALDSVRGRPRGVVSGRGGVGTWGIAILSRLRVTRSFEVDLGLPRGDVVARRAALCIEVDVHGTPLLVAGVHASHRLWGSPLQMRTLDARLAVETVPSVIAGDLNMWGPVLQRVMPRRRRAVRGRTWPARLPHSQIDHIWVGPGVEVLSGEVRGRAGSDHRPIRARVRL